MTERTFVIVGGGLAAAKAAEGARKEGFDGRLIVLSAEDEMPYERPHLSKEYLRGEDERDALAVHPPEWYDEQRVDLRLGARAEAVDLRAREVRTAAGEVVRFDRLLLATGSRARELDVPGVDVGRVFTLRDLPDADGLRAAIREGSRLVVIGAGWIGTEVAASARTLGAEVTVVSPGGLPLERVLGADLGQLYHDLHAQHGVTWRLGSPVAGIERGGGATVVRLADGTGIEADVVLAGVGGIPNVEPAREAGLAMDERNGGVEVDERFRTSVPEVFAAGDIASQQHPTLGERVRVEHWGTARFGGLAAGRALAGSDKAYDRLPYFYSDQYDLSMEYWGHAARWDRVVVRADVDGLEFSAWWIADGRVVAGLVANNAEDRKEAEALVKARPEIEPARLADPEVPLTELAFGSG